MKHVASGAEAEIYIKDNNILKKRVPKRYRIKEIDNSLRKFRTRREAKVLEKLPVIGPKLISMDDKEMTIEMTNINGKRLRDILEDKLQLCKQVGEKLAIMHNEGIIHGDLTTSNMIYDDEVYFIDFGLSFFSHKIEDKAVDLHLIKEALESKHHTVFKEAFKLVLQGYKTKVKYYKQIISRLEKVESRGRNKNK